jgi:hypothetical protein
LGISLDQQQSFVTEMPNVFSPVPGGWGRMGMTLIDLQAAEPAVMKGALETAYRNLQQKQAGRKPSRRAKTLPITKER